MSSNQTFNALFQHPNPETGKYENLWVLVNDPDSREFKHGLSPAAQGDTISTGFHNPTMTQLGTHCNRMFENLYPYEDEKRIADYTFVIMDERSVKDKTAKIVQWDVELQKDENGQDIDDSLFVARWVSARASFRDCSSWMRILTHGSIFDSKIRPSSPVGEDDLMDELPVI